MPMVYKQDGPRLNNRDHNHDRDRDRASSASEFCSRAATFIEELSSIFKGPAHPDHHGDEDTSSPDSGYLSPKSREPTTATAATATGEELAAPPHFSQKLKSQEVAEGSPIRLECRVTAHPPPLVRWFCEGRELHHCPDIQISRQADLHTLVIAEAFEDDTGRYTCVASNRLGADNTSAEVYIEGASSSDSEGEGSGQKARPGAMPQVQKKTTSVSLTIRSSSPKSPEALPHRSTLVQPLSAPPQRVQSPVWSLQGGVDPFLAPPVFSKLLQDTQASEGQVVVLECRVRGAPPLQVCWYRQGQEIQDSPDFRVLQKKPRSAAEPEEICTLVIAETFPEDGGLFSCTATNRYGTVTSTAQLTVRPGELTTHTVNKDSNGVSGVGGLFEDPQGFPPPPPTEISLLELPPKPASAERFHVNELEIWPSVATLPAGREVFTNGKQSPPPTPPSNESPPPTPPSHAKDGPPLPTKPKLSDGLNEKTDNHSTPRLLLQRTQQSLILDQPPHGATSGVRSAGGRIGEVGAWLLRHGYEGMSRTESLQEMRSHEPTAGSRSRSETEEGPLASYGQSSEVTLFPVQWPARPLARYKYTATCQERNSALTEAPLGTAALTFSHLYSSAEQLKQLQAQILLEQQEAASWQEQEVPPPPQEQQQEVPPPSPPLPPPPSFQELEQSEQAPPSTMQTASTFNYARPKQFIAAQSPGSQSSGSPPSPQSSDGSSPFGSTPQSPASFLVSILPQTPTAPVNALGLPKGNGTVGFSRKPSRTPRLASDSEIQGSKDAVIQDLERKLRFKEERMSNGQQKLTYEEKMARRLLGAHSAASVFKAQQSEEEPGTQECSSPDIDSVPQKEYKVSSFEQRLISEIEFRLERSPVEESDDDVQHDEDEPGQRVAPFFNQKLKHFKVFEGMPVTFSCKVIGDPKPKIYWFKDGKQISKRSEHYRISRDEDGTCSLHTAAASIDDDGNYTIMAGNPEGRTSCTGRMMVQAVNQRGRSQRSTPGHIRRPRSRSRDSGDENENIQERHFRPHFLQAPGDLIVQEGKLCRMDCKVSGLPTPDLIWQLNGQIIRPDSGHKMLVRENGVHSLIIEPVTSRDAGIYTCIASNRAGHNSFNLELIVAAKEMHKAPSFIEKLQNTGVAEGYPIRLECRVSGVPYPQIFWKKENESLTHNTERVSMHQDSHGYICMIIQPATKEDAGWYTVSAKNEAGIVSSTARLDVHTQWQQSHTPKPKKVRPSSSRYAALTERGLDVKAAFFPESSPALSPGGLVESDDL
ncbi:hypothetical protein AAFF_G00437660 [Aldrovandia affinis]|uniref:Palladin n=1 Tax=Aldrovandia affinis TaxID=143900 RepID=A0AAD7S7P1_9TELE|nr:hypothetical protein AAFF_G00437660 [Aldrovandia affinis]